MEPQIERGRSVQGGGRVLGVPGAASARFFLTTTGAVPAHLRSQQLDNSESKVFRAKLIESEEHLKISRQKDFGRLAPKSAMRLLRRRRSSRRRPCATLCF